MDELNEHIDEYIRGELSDAERKNFQQKMDSDPDFAKKVKQQQVLAEGITAYGQQQLKYNLQQMHQELFEEPKPRYLYALRWPALAAAASIALLAILAYWLWFSNPNPQQLFASHFEPYPVNFASRAISVAPEASDIQKLYIEQRYAEALPGMEKLLQLQSDHQRLRLALGIAYLAENKADQSIETLKAIDDPLLQAVSKWYMALAYLQKNESASAKSLLEDIVKEDTSNMKEKASELLERIN